MRLPYVDRMLWVPAELADSARIRADLTITPDAYKDDAEPVLLYEEKPGMIGVPRAWGLRKLAWLTGGTVPEDRTVKPVRLWPSLRFPEGWSYRKGQQSAIETLYQSFHVSKLYGSILEADCGSGKGQPVDAKVLTPAGWRAIGDLRVGDLVIDPDTGLACDVIGVYPRGLQSCYEVGFSDDTTLVVDADHLWHVQERRHKYQEFVTPTWSLAEAQLRTVAGWRYFIPLTHPVDFQSADALPVDPYLLGVLLGDGSMRTQLSFTCAEPELCTHVRTALPGGMSLSYQGGYNYNVVDTLCVENRVTNHLRRLNLWGKLAQDKFIPHEYLFSSPESRLALIQGLCDTDGEAFENNLAFGFCTSSWQLAQDVAFLVRSLGGTATQTDKMPTYTYRGESKIGLRAYRLYCMLPKTMIPFRLTRKSSNFTVGQKKHPLKSITSVTPCALKRETVCIAVASRRNLYVTENFTVTHNTLMGTAVASRLHTPTLVVVHKDDLAEQWKNTLKTFFPGAICGHVQGKKWDYENKHVVVATAQTLYRHRADLPYDFSHGFGCVIYDEAHRYPARTFERVLKLFPCRHRLAVSATLRRADKMECVWYWHVGHVEARCSGLKVTGDYIQIPWTTGLTDEMMRLYGDVSIVKWCNAIAENGPFNNWLVSQCLEGHKAGRKVLVVSDRVEQLCLLRTKIMESGVASATVGMYVGSMPVPGRTTRKKVSIAELKTASECDIILATYGKMAEGTDISDLDTLFFATPRTDIEQVVGRLQRPHDGKKQLLIVDPVFQTPYNRRLANKRREIYKSLEFNERRSGSE